MPKRCLTLIDEYQNCAEKIYCSIYTESINEMEKHWKIRKYQIRMHKVSGIIPHFKCTLRFALRMQIVLDASEAR